MQRPTFDQVIVELKLESSRGQWRCYWPAWADSPAVDGQWLLVDGHFEETIKWLDLPAAKATALDVALRAIKASPHARELFSQVVRTLSMAHVQPPPLPLPPRELVWGRLFQALVIMGCIPTTRMRHMARGLAPRITRATFNDIDRGIRQDSNANPGENAWIFTNAGWLFNHVSGRLIELGRLQFGRSLFDLPFNVFRDRASGECVALAIDGQRIRPDGQFLLADRGIDRDGPHFVTRFDQRENLVVGHRVNAAGAIESSATTLDLTQFECVLEAGSTVLDVHIPAGAPLDPEACRESFRQASELFLRHYPEHPVRGYTCVSWLMDPQLGRSLPAESNIVEFLGMFERVPVPHGSDRQTFERVFGGPVDPATGPRKTHLQRAILDHVLAGGRWRHGGGLIVARP